MESEKFDRIDKLSMRLEDYIKENAARIERSKNCRIELWWLYNFLHSQGCFFAVLVYNNCEFEGNAFVAKAQLEDSDCEVGAEETKKYPPIPAGEQRQHWVPASRGLER